MAMLVRHINDDLPKLSYSTLLQIFTGICLTYSFASILVTATVHYLYFYGATPVDCGVISADAGMEEVSVSDKETILLVLLG